MGGGACPAGLNVVNEIFVFASREGKTRLQGDWSSDVCSSDLGKGSLVIKRLTMGGKKALDAKEFLRGYPQFLGATLI